MGNRVTPAGEVVFRGNVRLCQGVNHFWLSCQLSPTANLSHKVDATCTKVETSVGTITPQAQPTTIGKRSGEKKHALLFANPHTQSGRTHHTIQVSFDDGRTWPKKYHHLLDEGWGAGYPSLSRVDDTHVGIVYEGSQSHVVFEKFSLDELLRRR